MLPWAMPWALLLIQPDASFPHNVGTRQLLRHTQVPKSLLQEAFVVYDTPAIQNAHVASPAYWFCSSMTKNHSSLFS